MEPLKVLVIDDSDTMRLLISDIIDSDPAISVIAALSSGEEALEKLPQLKPQCIILDLHMPGMDGLTTLKAIMSQYPTPVIILSAQGQNSADITFNCLASGAISFIPKPASEYSFGIAQVKKKLIAEIKKISDLQTDRFKYLLPFKNTPKIHWKPALNYKIIVIGASTGGPQTLETFLSGLPANFPVPIVIAQHLPLGKYINSFIDRLNTKCWIKIKIAQDLDKIEPGAVYCIAPGTKISLLEKNKEILFSIKKEKKIHHSPNIDQVMQAIAETYKERTIGVILTGMGRDGLKGMQQIKYNGGYTVVQGEDALLCGMPEAVIQAGIADRICAIDVLPQTLFEVLQK